MSSIHVYCNMRQCSSCGDGFSEQSSFIPLPSSLLSMMSLILLVSQVPEVGVHGWLVGIVQPWRQCTIQVYPGAGVFGCFYFLNNNIKRNFTNCYVFFLHCRNGRIL